MPTTANAQKDSVVITANILAKSATEIHASMAGHVSTVPMGLADMHASAQREQQGSIAKKTPEMNVHTIPAKTKLSALIELVIMIAIALQNIEVKIATYRIRHLLVV